ncbi:hypothetical protein D3C72_1002610 [compost metagenome]
MAGKYVTLRLTPGTTVTADSETVPTASGEAGFAPQRIIAPGYYWASAYDTPHTATIVWPVQQQSLQAEDSNSGPESVLDQELIENPESQPQELEPSPSDPITDDSN